MGTIRPVDFKEPKEPEEPKELLVKFEKGVSSLNSTLRLLFSFATPYIELLKFHGKTYDF